MLLAALELAPAGPVADRLHADEAAPVVFFEIGDTAVGARAPHHRPAAARVDHGYGAATTDVVDIVLHGRVIVKDVLILKGTDSKYYKINVNGGTISATEVSL